MVIVVLGSLAVIQHHWLQADATGRSRPLAESSYTVAPASLPLLNASVLHNDLIGIRDELAKLRLQLRVRHHETGTGKQGTDEQQLQHEEPSPLPRFTAVMGDAADHTDEADSKPDPRAVHNLTGDVRVYQGALSKAPTVAFAARSVSVEAIVSKLRALHIHVLPTAQLVRRGDKAGSVKRVMGSELVGAGDWDIDPPVLAPPIPLLGVLVMVNMVGVEHLFASIDVPVGQIVVVQQMKLPWVTEGLRALQARRHFQWVRWDTNRGVAAGWNRIGRTPCDDRLNSLCWRLIVNVCCCSWQLLCGSVWHRVA